jgi:MtrB/PioB family decaheme-associated outer membrane protein
VNPELAVAIPLPRGDAEGEIDATNLGLRLTSRPLPKLRVSAGYRFDDRDNDTPRDVFVYVPGDSLPQDTLDSDRARMNLPNSYRLHEARLDVGYDVAERTEVSAGYERQREERSWTEVDQVDEDVVRAGFRTQALSWLDFRVDGAWSRRDAGDYFFEAPVIWGFSPEHVATLPPDELFENAPAMRKFLYADRDRGEVDVRLAVAPVERASLALTAGWAHDSYSRSELGLRWRESWSFGLDGSWSPIDLLTAYAYYAYERFHSRQKGRSWNNATQVYDPARDWAATDLDGVHTVGFGAEWTGFAERVTLRGGYTFSRAKDAIDVDVGPALASGPTFPDARTHLHDVSAQAEYLVREGIRARVGYLFEALDVDDWARDRVGPTTINEVLGLGLRNPDYQAHLFAVSLEYEF